MIWSSSQCGYLVICSICHMSSGHLVIWSPGHLVIWSSGHLVISNIMKSRTILVEHLNNLRA